MTGSATEGDAFEARLALVRSDLTEALTAVYGELPQLVDDVVSDARAALEQRPEALRRIDRRREIDPTWFLAEDMVGYVAYADRFAGDLAGVRERLDYLDELGVRYLHLMPLLKPREGESDGGYAVADYDAVDPRLGDMADLEALARDLHERGMALTVDLVLNHTAREHEWAQRALAGEQEYRDFYRIYPDRTVPDSIEATVPDVFPDMAPGSFTHLPETDEWVWTSFHEFQWDLNWENPAVFRAMLGVLLRLANHGVDVVRLDAVPFLWKREGTDCQNQPEAHRILQALRAATRLAAPGLVLKAEAIVGPDQLVPYLGRHEVQRPECHLAYDNQLMVMLWSCLASRDTGLARQALRRRPGTPPGTGWVTYVRCHDDIGWAVADADAHAVGVDPAAHRAFLAAFYGGRHDGGFARGVDFGSNPASGDVRTSGSAAALAGLVEARELGDREAEAAALDRLELLHAVAYAHGGIPLLYMGDELALTGDPDWASEPDHDDDNRWLHRPRMDWDVAARRHEAGTVEARLFAALQRLGRARAGTEALRSDGETRIIDVPDHHVLAFVRQHPRARPLLVCANFSDGPSRVDAWVLQEAGITEPRRIDRDEPLQTDAAGTITLPAWGYVWIGG